MAKDTAVVHVTHEAAAKIGGIGAVLEGFFTSNRRSRKTGSIPSDSSPWHRSALVVPG